MKHPIKYSETKLIWIKYRNIFLHAVELVF